MMANLISGAIHKRGSSGGSEIHKAMSGVLQRTPEAIHREGFLEKRPVSKSLSTAWKRRWITLTASRITWSDSLGGKAQSSLPLGPSATAVLKPGGTELEVIGTDRRKLVLRGNDLDGWHASITALVCGPTLVHRPAPFDTAVVAAAALPPAPPVALPALGAPDARLVERLQATSLEESGAHTARVAASAHTAATTPPFATLTRSRLEEEEEEGAEVQLDDRAGGGTRAGGRAARVATSCGARRCSRRWRGSGSRARW